MLKKLFDESLDRFLTLLDDPSAELELIFFLHEHPIVERYFSGEPIILFDDDNNELEIYINDEYKSKYQDRIKQALGIDLNQNVRSNQHDDPSPEVSTAPSFQSSMPDALALNSTPDPVCSTEHLDEVSLNESDSTESVTLAINSALKNNLNPFYTNPQNEMNIIPDALQLMYKDGKKLDIKEYQSVEKGENGVYLVDGTERIRLLYSYKDKVDKYGYSPTNNNSRAIKPESYRKNLFTWISKNKLPANNFADIIKCAGKYACEIKLDDKSVLNHSLINTTVNPVEPIHSSTNSLKITHIANKTSCSDEGIFETEKLYFTSMGSLTNNPNTFYTHPSNRTKDIPDALQLIYRDGAVETSGDGSSC